MSDEKVSTMQQVCARISDAAVKELDAYVREREREARVPLSRSLGIREILETWAADRAAARVDSVDSVDKPRTRQHV